MRGQALVEEELLMIVALILTHHHSEQSPQLAHVALVVFGGALAVLCHGALFAYIYLVANRDEDQEGATAARESVREDVWSGTRRGDDSPTSASTAA
jgi:hypothetical protein